MIGQLQDLREKYSRQIKFLGYDPDTVHKIDEKTDRVLIYITEDLIITLLK